MHHLNRKAISFWLNAFVFPSETMQYPYKITATPWNLANNSRVNGFSGTDDNRLLLPLQVTQQIANSKVIKATNGKMLHIFSAKNRKYIPLANSKSVFDQLFEIIYSERTNTLIDCGGLVVGTTNKQFAVKLLEIINDFNAVTFFNSDTRSWQILNRFGELWNIERAPIQVKDTFVYFDEYRCRGADMKLLPDACALVTLGPKMNKDKLFQAIARLRGIDKSQSFVTCGTVEVSKSIRNLVNIFDADGNCECVIKSEDILNWVTDNTIKSIKVGMTQWCSQGLIFCHTENMPVSRSLQPEITELVKFYAHSLQNKSVFSIYEEMKRNFNSQAIEVAEGYDGVTEITEKMSETIMGFGSDYELLSSNHDEECEKELEKEVEQEEEKEKETIRKEPFNEIDWLYEEILSKDFEPSENFALLSTFIKNRMDKEFSLRINWDDNIHSIYVSENFAVPINCKTSDSLEEYLRPVNFCLHFKESKSFVLISEREANMIIKLRLIEGCTRILLDCLEFPDKTKLIGSIVRLKLFNGVH